MMQGYKTLDQALEDAPAHVEFTCDKDSFSLRNETIKIAIDRRFVVDTIDLGFRGVSPNIIYHGRRIRDTERIAEGIVCDGVGLGDATSFSLEDVRISNSVYLYHSSYHEEFRSNRFGWYPIGSEEAAELLRRLPTALLRRDAASKELGTELLRVFDKIK